ncbi:MAG TPA: hypothetical protein VIL32_16320 [Steroidobacteraceae bacterium]
MSTQASLIHAAQWLVRWAGLSLALAIAQVVSGVLTHAALGHTVSEAFLNVPFDWLGFFTVAGLEAAAVCCLLTGLRVERRHQIWILFAFYWGTKYLQMSIEGAFYLNVWQTDPLMSWSEVAFSLCYGTVTSLLFAPMAVWIVNVRPTEAQEPARVPPFTAALKIAALYVPIYFLAGMVLAIPLAGSAFDTTYDDLHLPAWIPLFQFVRGLLWAALLWLVIGNHTRERDSRITAAVALGIISSFQLLLPNPYMADQLRSAHLTEVLVSMTLFGWLAAQIGRDQASFKTAAVPREA